MDPVRTEVMRNRFAAIAEEASHVAYRSAYTTFVKQTQDYQVALASEEGEFFAYPSTAGVTSFAALNLRCAVDEIGIDRLDPGDIIITNDPFSGGALCTHTMDIHLIRPVFRDGAIVAFAWSFIHASDIGGAVPGSISPSSYEVFQEGVRIRPALLYRRDELNEPLWRFFADNSRIPDLIWGDLQAMLSGLALLDRRVQGLCDRDGPTAFRQDVAAVLALSEAKARTAIARLTDGEYLFHEYLEAFGNDGFIFMQARMHKQGETLAVDFAGSDPQVRAALNFVTGDRPHPFLCLPVINWILTAEPTAPLSGGLIRPIRTAAPPGSFMNAAFPAAMGNRWVAVMRVYDAVLGCLHQAVPGGVGAAGAGQAGIISIASTDERTGRRHVSVVEPFIGGSGGRVCSDGVDGIDQAVGFLRSAPVEVVEIETPLLIRRFALEPGTPGAGRFRGGHALRIEIENRSLAAVMTVRGLERFRFQPWGVDGGGSGGHASCVLNPGDPGEQAIGRIDVLELRPGDRLRMTTPSGGGCGDPFERDVAAVLDEVLDGLLSPDAARALYGVAIRGGSVDAEATAALRAVPRPVPAPFTVGPTRAALEAVWPPEVSAALARAVADAPPTVRTHLVKAARDRLGTDGTRVEVATALAALREVRR